MPKLFRKRPVVVEAVETPIVDEDGVLFNDVPQWLAERLHTGFVVPDGFGGLYIETLEGTMRADRGDWIIRGVSGEIYPCKPDIFEKTYELVQEPAKD